MTFERMAFELWILERILNDWNPLNPSVSCQGSCCYPDPAAGVQQALHWGPSEASWFANHFALFFLNNDVMLGYITVYARLIF